MLYKKHRFCARSRKVTTPNRQLIKKLSQNLKIYFIDIFYLRFWESHSYFFINIVQETSILCEIT